MWHSWIAEVSEGESRGPMLLVLRHKRADKSDIKMVDMASGRARRLSGAVCTLRKSWICFQRRVGRSIREPAQQIALTTEHDCDR